ncbi:MFS transporter protein [Rutstroemia sp. NJR-2017a WRK4]|nr:MFS transporter protein [Rutstroemia sp. NJR-2017a WRK4]
MCFILCIYTAIVLGIQYLFFGAFRIVYSDVYGFDAWQVALTFIGMLLGMTVAVATGQLGIWNYRRLVTKREREDKYYEGPEPEYRLPSAVVGAPFITFGLFWFAWTINPSIHWLVSIFGSSLFGFGSILVYSGIFTFFVDAYPLYTASALGANSFTRSMFAAGFPLFGVQISPCYHSRMCVHSLNDNIERALAYNDQVFVLQIWEDYSIKEPFQRTSIKYRGLIA